MEINTKFNVGETVWFDSFNTPRSGVISQITSKTNGVGDPVITYQIDAGESWQYDRVEEELYPSLEHYIDSLNRIHFDKMNGYRQQFGYDPVPR